MIKQRFDGLLYKSVIVVIGIAFVSGCSSFDKPSKPEPVPEIHPGILQGYLPIKAHPDSLALVPPPPAKGSIALSLDEKINQEGMTLRGSARWKLAYQDSILMFPEAAGTFSCALNAPITEQDTPHLYMLLRRTLADAGLSTYTAKNHYKRPRPFVLNNEPICSPDDEEMLRGDGSYPSGHTAIGWAWALILSEIAPEQADALLARGWAFGQSRMICNVHWQSDVMMGRTMGAAAVSVLHADPKFRDAVEHARDELEAVRAKGLPPSRDCKAEAAALAEYPQPAPWPANR
ncbi:MAG: phosphatase PAP2 family protein [Pseudomonadales bacterium]|nr:phosphatase PAP2 family protein [Pseudomonadales bacterium]